MSRKLAVEIFSKYTAEAFTYNPNDKIFRIGQAAVPLIEKFGYVSEEPQPSSEAEIATLIDAEPMLIQFDEELFSTPVLRNWLKGQGRLTSRDIQDGVIEAMTEAYVLSGGKKSATKFKGNSYRDFGFGISEYFPEFRVFGDCACLAPNPDGYIFNHMDWEDGYAQYGFHNVDKPFELVALLAGAGALASMCKAEL